MARRSRTSPACGRSSATAMSPAWARPCMPAARPADLARAQRTGHGPCRHRLRQADAPPASDGLHHLHRPGRDQHGHRRRAGARQSLAGAAAAGRRVRQPPAGSGAAADGGFQRRHGVGERLLQAGLALLRPHHPARTTHRFVAQGVGDHAGSGQLRPGDAGLLPGRAGRGLRLSGTLLRAPRVAAASPECGLRASWMRWSTRSAHRSAR